MEQELNTKTQTGTIRLITVLFCVIIMLIVTVVIAFMSHYWTLCPKSNGVNLSPVGTVSGHVLPQTQHSEHLLTSGLNNNGIPSKVKWSLNTMGMTILDYELGNTGNDADREAVLAVLTRRLVDTHRQHPNISSDQLVESVASKWNPNDVKSWTALKFKAEARSYNMNTKLLDSAKTGRYKSVTAQQMWDRGATDYAHKTMYPAYYSDMPRSYKVDPSSSDISIPLVYATQ